MDDKEDTDFIRDEDLQQVPEDLLDVVQESPQRPHIPPLNLKSPLFGSPAASAPTLNVPKTSGDVDEDDDYDADRSARVRPAPSPPPKSRRSQATPGSVSDLKTPSWDRPTPRRSSTKGKSTRPASAIVPPTTVTAPRAAPSRPMTARGAPRPRTASVPAPRSARLANPQQTTTAAATKRPFLRKGGGTTAGIAGVKKRLESLAEHTHAHTPLAVAAVSRAAAPARSARLTSARSVASPRTARTTMGSVTARSSAAEYERKLKAERRQSAELERKLDSVATHRHLIDEMGNELAALRRENERLARELLLAERLSKRKDRAIALLENDPHKDRIAKLESELRSQIQQHHVTQETRLQLERTVHNQQYEIAKYREVMDAARAELGSEWHESPTTPSTHPSDLPAPLESPEPGEELPQPPGTPFSQHGLLPSQVPTSALGVVQFIRRHLRNTASLKRELASRDQALAEKAYTIESLSRRLEHAQRARETDQYRAEKERRRLIALLAEATGSGSPSPDAPLLAATIRGPHAAVRPTSQGIPTRRRLSGGPGRGTRYRDLRAHSPTRARLDQVSPGMLETAPLHALPRSMQARAVEHRLLKERERGWKMWSLTPRAASSPSALSPSPSRSSRSPTRSGGEVSCPAPRSPRKSTTCSPTRRSTLRASPHGSSCVSPCLSSPRRTRDSDTHTHTHTHTPQLVLSPAAPRRLTADNDDDDDDDDDSDSEKGEADSEADRERAALMAEYAERVRMNRLVERALHNAIIAPLASRLLRSAASSCVEEEAALAANLERLASRPQSFFGINEKHVSPTHFQTAVEALRDMEQTLLPSEMLSALIHSAEEIHRIIGAEHPDKAQLLAADDFVPIHQFVIVRAHIRSPLARSYLMQSLCDPDRIGGKRGYFLTCFAASLEYLKGLRPAPPPERVDDEGI
eukprot:gnl/Trimastix_PCT/3093.p1 GENE.gnl/Trimastix_PCT/3093~~gnl/Trimastix_PCT/3093.p1  ORF type:complete len:925 (+),score=220.52 gnl/Trimastix_PCT/3093:28-2802(+)